MSQKKLRALKKADHSIQAPHDCRLQTINGVSLQIKSLRTKSLCLKSKRSNLRLKRPLIRKQSQVIVTLPIRIKLIIGMIRLLDSLIRDKASSKLEVEEVSIGEKGAD